MSAGWFSYVLYSTMIACLMVGGIGGLCAFIGSSSLTRVLFVIFLVGLGMLGAILGIGWVYSVTKPKETDKETVKY